MAVSVPQLHWASLCPTNMSLEQWASKKMAVRTSQVKFELLQPLPHQETFEVCRAIGEKTAGHANLNVQLIPLFVRVGVEEQNLLEMAEEAHRRAVRLFQRACSGEKQAVREVYLDLKSDSHPSSEEALYWMSCGYCPTWLPRLRSLFEQIAQHRAAELLDGIQPKIPVAASTSVVMIPDVLGLLREGEVCLISQVRDEQSQRPVYEVDGEVVIVRAPVHMPEHVVRATAVHCQEYKDLCFHDILIVNIKDEVSIAQRLSGGDYDGDCVQVFWDARIVDFVRDETDRRGLSAKDLEAALEQERQQLQHAWQGENVTAKSDMKIRDLEGGFQQGLKMHAQDQLDAATNVRMISSKHKVLSLRFSRVT